MTQATSAETVRHQVAPSAHAFPLSSDDVTLERVLRTSLLAARPSRAPDNAAENRALHAISLALNASPEAALDALVQQALALCVPGGNGSTGVSLLDAEGDDQRFRWTAMAGRLAQHIGGTTPRDFSPCGVCLDHNAPVLFLRPDTYFTYFLATGAPFIEGLVLPFHVDGKQAGTIWVVSHDDAHQFDAEDVRLMTSLAEFTGLTYAAIRGREALVDANRERDALLVAECAARREAELANRSKSDFLALMSHELRTPLNAIGGYVDLIALGIRGPVTEAQRADLARIQASQRHLLGLINQVLNYTRADAGAVMYDLADVRVSDAFAAAEPLVAPQALVRGLTHHMGTCPADLAVRADPEKLQQILLNLLSNAVKFTESGGEVRVDCAARDGMVAISVADTGIGVPRDKLAAIFEPFVQVDQRLVDPHEGVGLGLAISRQLARGMGGELEAASTPGAGSTFTLLLPRSA